MAQGDEQEIEVEEELELLVKHHRDETDDRVFLIAGNVRRIGVGSADCQEQKVSALTVEALESQAVTYYRVQMVSSLIDW